MAPVLTAPSPLRALRHMEWRSTAQLDYAEMTQLTIHSSACEDVGGAKPTTTRVPEVLDCICIALILKYVDISSALKPSEALSKAYDWFFAFWTLLNASLLAFAS